MIGQHLIPKLIVNGYDVAILGRSKKENSAANNYLWDIEKQEIEERALDNVSHIVHLAGANLGEKRWSNKRKQLLIDSRVKSAQLLFEKFKESGLHIKTYISASAIGYYGAVTTDHIFIESDFPADDYLGKLCTLWERSADDFSAIAERVVKLRTGVVLSEIDGALEKMIRPIKAGFGSPLGSGKQFMPWIHIDDLCDIYLKSLMDKTINGSYNAVSPDFSTNRDITLTIARVLKKKIRLPNVPAFLLKLIFGEMADIILEGSRVSADKIISTGYKFIFEDPEKALNELIGMRKHE